MADSGAREHYACVPARAAPEIVRRFGAFAAGLTALAAWFQEYGVASGEIEAMGVCGMAVFQLLSGQRGSDLAAFEDMGGRRRW